MSDYISLQGEVFFAKVVNGVAGPISWRGNVPTAEIEISGDIFKHKEAWSGDKTTDLIIGGPKAVMLTMTIEELTAENKAYILNGENHDIVGEAITDRSLGTVAVNQEIILDGYNLTAVVVKDSTATPVIVDPSKYVLDATFGTIKFTDVASLTMPLTWSGVSGSAVATTIATSSLDEYMVFFKGTNTIDQKKIAVELWRTMKEPSSKFALINEQVASYDVSAECLSDRSKRNDPTLGAFGRLIEITPVA